MANKIRFLSDGAHSNDQATIVRKGTPRGHVRGYVHNTDIPIFDEWITPSFEEDNKVLIDGSMYTAGKHFGLLPKVNLPTYNTALNLENIVPLTASEQLDAKVFLFCVGTSGCGPENSQKYDVNYTKWIAPEDLVPFRYQLKDNDLGATLRNKYFGRKEIVAANRIAYYFKGFDIEPYMVAQYTDGTPIDENVYISDNDTDAEVYVEMKLSITKEDCRDFPIATSGINDARINTISLCSAYPKTYNGYTYYQGIRPFTRLNFSNESLIDLTKGIDIIYDLYY